MEVLMKKLSLLLCLLLLLTSCGPNKDSNPAPKTETSEQKNSNEKENSEDTDINTPETSNEKLAQDETEDDNKDDEETPEATPVEYDSLDNIADNFDFEEIKGNIIDIADPALGTAVLTKDKKIFFDSPGGDKELGKFDNIVKLRHDLSINSILVAEQDDGKFTFIDPNHPETILKNIEMKDPMGVILGLGGYVYFTIEEEQLYINILDKQEGDTEPKKLRIKVYPDENLDFMIDESKKSIFKGKIVDGFVQYTSPIVLTEEGKAYVLKATTMAVNTPADKLPEALEYNISVGFGFSENVSKIFHTGQLGGTPIPPIFAKKNDQDNIYYKYSESITVVKEDKIPLPEGVKIDDLKEVFSEGGMLIVTNDNKAYYLEDVEDEREWEELEDLSKLLEEGKVKRITNSIMEYHVLLDDGNIYEVD